MQVIRRSGQNYPNNVNRIQGDYEIRTFTNQRNRSPNLASSQNIGRSPISIYDQGNSESALGEMFYLEPNETNFRNAQNMSPLNDSRNMILRSPIEGNRNEIGSGGIINMSQRMNYSHAPRFQQNNIEDRKESNSRSPKTINVGESPQDMEYNIKTFNRRNNNINMMNSPQNNFVGDRSYNMMLNDTGNIFLDQPMQQAYNQTNEQNNYSLGMIQQGINDPRGSLDQNSREIQFGMNPRDLQEPMHGVLRKMSPKGNVEGDSDTNSDKNDNVNQIKDLKSQLDKNTHHVMFRNEDGIGIGDRNLQNRGDLENLEIMAKTREFQENVTGEEVKKLIKYYVKTYDPHKGEDGNLISNSQTVLLSNPDQIFNDRYRVLQKMNKLSSILLAKNRGATIESASPSRSIGEDGKNKFDKTTLNNTVYDKKRTLRNKKRNKFLYVSLAMLSAKGPNTEDRTILRRMRLDKGGVVDLAQETLQKKSKFKIKKARAGGRGITTLNPKYREKAAKIVQAWWRERKEKYKRILEQIIKIQSVWRGKFTRKYIYDVIYISYLQEKFLSIMRNVLVNHVRPLVFDELFSKNKLIKDTMGDLLLNKDRRYTLLRIRPYFLKWKENSDLLSQKLLKTKELFDKKEKGENKLNILRKYFDKWVLLKNLYKYIGEAKDAEEKKNKFLGTINMINGLSSLTKRQVFKNTREPIGHYLKDLLKQKILIKLVKTICKKFLQSKLQYYLNKWRITKEKMKIEEFKRETFINIINHMDSRLDKIKMKYYLDKWRRHIPRIQKLLLVKDGSDVLSKFALRKAINDPLNAFSEKLDDKKTKQALLKMIIIKSRKMKDNLKYYFDKWRNNRIRLDDKDKRNEIYKNLLKNIINKINNRILYKRFNQWRARPKVDVTGEMRKINDFVNILHDVCINHYNDDYKNFLDRLNKTRDPHSLKNGANKLFKIYNNKRNIILRYYLYRWRSQNKRDELKDLHRQLLRYIITSLQAKNNRNTLGKYLTRWRLFVGDSKNYDNIDKLKDVLRGGDLLDKLYKRRLRDLMNRLYRKLGKDYRPKLLGKLIKNIDKPRSTLRELFNRWKNTIDKDKSNVDITKYKAKIINTNVNNLKKRNDRDRLMRAFFHWRAMSKKPEEYYPRINNLLNSLAKYAKKKATSEPFDLIKISRNPTRHLMKLIKNYDNQEKRLLNGKLRNLLGRWRKAASDTNAKDLKARILYNIKVYLDELQKKKLLSKYLTKWKLNSGKKGLDVNFGKGIDKLTEVFKAPARKMVYDAYINKIKNVLKQKGANDLLKSLNNHKNKILHNIVMDWWKKAATIDPNKTSKIETKLRKIIKKKDTEPLARAFRNWVKVVENSKLRDKDLYFATKAIGRVLRKNDKMILYNALSRWRHKIRQIREQYLKALLIKQIKTAQDVKDKMTNEARLRRALLKWRTNLISINYLDNIKKIRKGCKLFKLGLKKKHERDILNKLKNTSRQNGKKIILTKIIIETVPVVEKNNLKKYFDIWKSKLGDTEKMKNKLNALLKDYMYTRKFNQALYKKPKNDILDLFKGYSDQKKAAADKICKFVKGMMRIPVYNLKMKRNKLLDKIIKKKKDAIDDIKRIYLRGFKRRAEKDKINENASIIQKFIEIKLKKLLDKKNLIKQGLDLLNLHIKRKCLEKIKNTSKDKYTVIILKKIIHKKDDKKTDKLREAFNTWKNKIPEFKKLDAINKIQNAYRKHLANKKLKNLQKRKDFLKKIHEKYEKNNKNILDIYLRDWLHRALMTKNNDAATKIQRIFRQILDKKKNDMANDKLQKLFKKYTKHQLANVMTKVSKVIGGKGLVVYRTMADLIYKKPFNKLINYMNFIRRLDILEDVLPKINDRLREYFVPKALKKWKENTYDQTVKHAINLQKFLRDQYVKKMERNKERREKLLNEIVNRKIKNDLYKLGLPFNVWHKKARLEAMNEAATKIQNKFRENNAHEKKKNLKSINKFLKLIKLLQKKDLFDVVNNVKDNKKKKNSIKKILITILSKKMFIIDKASLENAFNKWRKINQKTNDNVTKIANAFRAYKARKEKDRLKRINDLLKKYFDKHSKNDDEIKRAKLRKWKNKAKLDKINDKVIFIQRFIRPILAKINNDKFKKFFNDNANKKICKLLLLAGKMNKLQHSLNYPRIRIFLDILEQVGDDKNKNDTLRKTVSDIDKKIRYIKLKKFIERWKDQHKKLGDKTNESALKIQKAYLVYKAIKEKNRLKNIKNKLKKFVSNKDDLKNNKLHNTLRKWIAIAKYLKLNDNALKIQDQWRKFQEKINNDKELARQLKIKNGLEKLFNIKFGCKYALDKINSEKNRNTFIKFNNDLENKRLDTLKNCLDSIKQKKKDNILENVLKIPDDFKRRLLKKFLFLLKDKTDKLAKIKCVNRIIKNWRYYREQKKQRNKRDSLQNILGHVILRTSNVLKKCFKRWKNTALKMREAQYKERIARFFEDRFRLANARKNWKKLYNKLKLKDKNEDLLEIVKKLKKNILLNKFKKPFLDIARKKLFDNLKKNKKTTIIYEKYIKLLPKRNEKSSNFLLKNYLKKWKDNTDKLNRRDDKMRTALDNLTKKQTVNDVNDITNVFLLKKLYNDIPLVRAKYFLQKIKENADRKNKYDKLVGDIKKAKDNLDGQKKKKLMNKLYKLYAFNKLNGLNNVLNKYLDKFKKLYGKELLDHLDEVKSKLSTYKYNNNVESTGKAKTTNLKYKSTPQKKNVIVPDKNAPMRKVLPDLVKYLQNIIDSRKEDTFDEVRRDLTNKSFAKLLKSFNNRTIEPDKREYIHKVRRETKYSEVRPIYQAKLYKLFRKKYVKYIKTVLVQPSRIYRLFYLLNMTRMHSNIASQRYHRELIRKWRFITFTKKMTKKKLELMYKNLHASYLQMADEIFGEDKVNPSVFKEFERFGSNVGMFTGQEKEVEEDINKKYYSNIDKKYTFTNRASAMLSDAQILKNEEYVQKLMKGYEEVEEEEEEGEIRRSNTSNPKDVKEQFDSLKQSGKYFPKNK